VSHTRERVGSPKESVPPGTWTESGQRPILRKVSSSPERCGIEPGALHAEDPDRVVIDLSDSHIWDASTAAALDAITTKYDRKGKTVQITG